LPDCNRHNTASTADAIIVGQTSDAFGNVLIAGDFNADGKMDLAVGTDNYSGQGRAYIFYNDGAYPTTASTADAIITGWSFTNFGYAMTAGDFNSDGRTDLAVGAYNYNSAAGRAYVFYNDGSFPTSSLAADVDIAAESLSQFGFSLAAGDFNSDGRIDLAVGADRKDNYTGRTYIFYNDGSYSATASTADVIIKGEAQNSHFGSALTIGDFNYDGKADLVVGANGYFGVPGNAYIFYNDGSIPTTASTADIKITGEENGSNFGFSLNAGDFNSDGKDDLAVGAYKLSADTGQAYVFYNDGSYPTTASTADIVIRGETGDNNFGIALTAGDFNTDGKTDLAVGANYYSGNTGRVYIFYGNVSNSKIASSVDVFITGETTNNYFGNALTAGDFNTDGKTDLAVGAYYYGGLSGRAYIFYNDGDYPATASTADIVIIGENSSSFGYALTSGDFNADSKTDLVIGGYYYSGNIGRAYIFYNDGSYPTTASTADSIITGLANSNFGVSLISGDFNFDSKTDLAVGATRYSSYTGRVFIFYNDGSYTATASTADVIINGEANSNFFGNNMVVGDFNSDGRTDLAVGAYQYGSYVGRVYVFYNDGSIPATASTADVKILGEVANGYFGNYLSAGDFNADNKTDLAVSANYYSNNTGRVYVFYNDGNYTATASSADAIITGETLVGYFGASLSAGDFNSDNYTDLAVGSYGNSSVYFITMKHVPLPILPEFKVRGLMKLRGDMKVR